MYVYIYRYVHTFMSLYGTHECVYTYILYLGASLLHPEISNITSQLKVAREPRDFAPRLLPNRRPPARYPPPGAHRQAGAVIRPFPARNRMDHFHRMISRKAKEFQCSFNSSRERSGSSGCNSRWR